MAVFRVDSSGNLFFQLFYRGSTHIDDVHCMQLLPGQVVELITTKGEELTPFSNPEYFDFDDES